MAKLTDALRRNRAESIAPRPATAQATAPAGSANQEFDGRSALKGHAKIKLDRIIPDPSQPRKTFEEAPLNRLAESMRVRGQLVPGLVRWSKDDGKYIVIDGERRYRAALLAGLTDFGCVVEDEADPDTILEWQLVTNALREGVPPVEQARAYERLMIAKGYSLRDLGEVLGIDHSSVAYSLNLLKLDGAIQDKVDAGQIAASTASQLTKLDPVDQKTVADRILDEGLSRAQTAVVVAEKAPRKPRAKGKAQPITSRRFEAGGFTIEARNPQGIDPVALAEALRAFLGDLEGSAGD